VFVRKGCLRGSQGSKISMSATAAVPQVGQSLSLSSSHTNGVTGCCSDTTLGRIFGGRVNTLQPFSAGEPIDVEVYIK
jgi:hypothetical protein